MLKRSLKGAAAGNPLRSWWNNRKQKEKREEEKKALEILNGSASYEQAFIGQLEKIDFLHSQISEEQLNYKTDPSQRYGDLENTAQWLIQKIARNTVNPSFNLREIDVRLMQMILRYNESIKLGHLEEAYVARAGLTKCFKEIRFALPEVLPIGTEKAFVDDYLEQCKEYLDGWINLLDQASLADQLYKNYQTAKDNADKKLKEHEQKLDEFNKKILDEYAEEYKSLSSGKTASTPKERELYNKMIDIGTQKTVYYTANTAADSVYTNYSQAKSRKDMLQVNTYNIPIARDPEAMNKYKQSIKDMFEQFTKVDQEVEESLKIFEEIDGQLEAINDLPGNVKKAEFAAKAAKEATNEIVAKQSAKIEAAKKQPLNMRKQSGILTDEELQAQLEEIERQNELIAEQQNVQVEEQQNVQTEEHTQKELLANDD